MLATSTRSEVPDSRRRAGRKVLLISPLPPPSGGIATWTRIILEKGLPAGFEPAVVNTAVVEFDGDSKLLRAVKEFSRTARILLATKYRVIVHNPTVVHLNCSLSCSGIFRDLLCGLIARTFRKPLLTQYRGDIPDYEARCRSKPLRMWALDSLFKISHTNVALNEHSIAYVGQRAPGRRALLLPNFIEDELAGGESSSREESASVTGVYVGNFLREKGIQQIIEVSKILPEVKFLLIGRDVEGLFSEPNVVPANVEVLGRLDRGGVLATMRRSDFLFFPSRSEGFPNAVLEAMATGLPVIATNVGAIPEMIVDGRGGILADKDDTDGLVNAIRTVTADQRLRREMGAYNIARTRELYSYSAVIRRLTDAYQAIV